jgi:hypothetical protein
MTRQTSTPLAQAVDSQGHERFETRSRSLKNSATRSPELQRSLEDHPVRRCPNLPAFAPNAWAVKPQLELAGCWKCASQMRKTVLERYGLVEVFINIKPLSTPAAFRHRTELGPSG